MSKRLLAAIVLCGMILLCGCGASNAILNTDDIEGGLPTAYTPQTLGEYANYDPEYEEVDYNSIGAEEMWIRSVIEPVSIYLSTNVDFEEQFGVSKYGVDQYYQRGDMILFSNNKDMETVLKNQQFQDDLNEAYGMQYQPKSYYMPLFETDYYDSLLLYTNNQYRFRSMGWVYDEKGEIRKVVWAVYDVQDRPKAEEIAHFYAQLDGLDLSSKNVDGKRTIYYFTADSWCAFFSKYEIFTDSPATAYFWEHEGVLGVIILAGEHKQENFDFCQLESHEF